MSSKRNVAFGFAPLLIAGLIAFTTQVSAQAPAPPLTVKPLSGGVYWTEGGDGGNTGFIIGKDGVIVIDAKTSPDSAKEMLADIAKLVHCTTVATTTIIERKGARTAVLTTAGFRDVLEDLQKAAGHRDPSTTKLYDRRGYNPEKAASFFAMS